MFIVLAACGALFLLTYSSTPLEQVLRCPAQNRETCIEKILSTQTQEEGIGEAFETFAALYNDDPAFKPLCHNITHAIGEAAYALFKEGDPIKPAEDMSYCGFGFYHGFMISLLADTHAPEHAREFCSTLAPLSKGSNAVSAACLHGFGHGISDDLPAAAVKKDPAASIAEELAICKRISQDAWEQSMCAGGVYNALDEVMIPIALSGDIAAFNQNQTYAICEAEAYEPFRLGCIRNFNGLLHYNTLGNFAAAAAQVNSMVNRSEAELAMFTFMDFEARYADNTTASADETAAKCYAVPSYLKDSCIRGYVSGLLEFSTPGEEYKTALVFCESSAIKAADKTSCFEEVARSSKPLYDSQLYAAVCDAFPTAYRPICESLAESS